MVLGSIPGFVTWDFFCGSFRQNHVPWGRLSLQKWVPGISPGVKASCAFGWRPTTLVVPKVEKIRALNLPGTPRATSACRGTPSLLLTKITKTRTECVCFLVGGGTATVPGEAQSGRRQRKRPVGGAGDRKRPHWRPRQKWRGPRNCHPAGRSAVCQA